MVKRFEIVDSHGWQYLEEEKASGRWVRYEDYAKLVTGIQAVLDGQSDSWPDQIHALISSPPSGEVK